jgi:Ni/Fe-hydrogenase 1 B-type cytochrome subunit
MSSSTDTNAANGELTASRGPVKVYSGAVRFWHWTNALAIVVLAVSGFLIARPLPSLSGEASDHFLMGYIRFAHFAAAYIFIIGFLGRIYLALIGDSHARQIFYVPLWNRSWWGDVLYVLRWYLFLAKEPKKFLGHNPLARLVMFFMFTLTTLFMIFTGGALYAEGEGIDSWQYAVFGWVQWLFGNPQNLHTWHHLGMWVLIVYVIIHVYTAIREEIMSRQSIISSMISGERTFRDDRP